MDRRVQAGRTRCPEVTRGQRSRSLSAKCLHTVEGVSEQGGLLFDRVYQRCKIQPTGESRRSGCRETPEPPKWPVPAPRRIVANPSSKAVVTVRTRSRPHRSRPTRFAVYVRDNARSSGSVCAPRSTGSVPELVVGFYRFQTEFVPLHHGYQDEIAEGVTTGYSVVPTW